MLTLDSTLIDKLSVIVSEAGEHLRRFYQGNVEIQIKPDHTPVTEADLFLSQFLTERLLALTPDIPVLSEENCKIPFSERTHWQNYWLIDPLDGTQQFINRTDQFSVVVALVQKQNGVNRPVVGIIHSPILGKTYIAMQNHGAFLIENGKKIDLRTRAKNRPNERLLITIGTSCNQAISDALQAPYRAEFVSYGSSSLKAGLVAEGKADCYIRLGDTGEWDTAAAEILLAELGGAIFSTDFQPLSYNQRETLINPHFIMVNNSQLAWQTMFRF